MSLLGQRNPGFIPPAARVAQPGSSDFRDVLRSMGFAQGGRGIRRPDGSYQMFNPVPLGQPDTRFENFTRRAPSFAERGSVPLRQQVSYISPEMQKMIDSGESFMIGRREFKYDRQGRPFRVNQDPVNTDMRGFMIDSEGRKTFLPDPTKKTKLQEFNLQNFQRARPGVRFANVARSSGLFGKTATMSPSVNYSFIGANL